MPGGNRAPFGTRREGRPSRLSVDEENLALVRRAFDLSAAGLTDRQVASECDLMLTHVRELLTNAFYAGRLRDGSPSALGALVEPATFDKVQALRARYSRRHRGSVHRRQYALSMLVQCGSCGRRLPGHGGRYRHVDACEGFKAAAPRVRRRFSRNNDQRMRGESYPADWYDEMVGEALKKVASSALLMTETMPIALAPDGAGVDPFTTARIERDREAATARYLRDRDVTGLQRAMERLDRDEQEARARPRDVVTAALGRHYLSNLAELWRDTQPEGATRHRRSGV